MTAVQGEMLPLPEANGASNSSTYDFSPELATDFLSLAPGAIGYLARRGHPDPEDGIASMYLRIARNGHPENLKDYMYAAAQRSAISDWRKHGRRTVESVNVDDVVGQLEEPYPTDFEGRATLRGIFASLRAFDDSKGEQSMDLTDLVEHLFVLGFSTAEYATMRDLPQATVRTRLGRARKHLNHLRQTGQL